MPIDDQALQMLRELAQQITTLQNSFTAQLRSLTETISRNAITYEQRLTAVERDLAGHVRLDEQKHDRADERLAEHSGEIKVLALQVGRDFEGVGKRLTRMDDLISQGKGVRLAWKIATAIAVFVSTVLGWLQLRKG